MTTESRCLRLLAVLPCGYDDRTLCPQCGCWARHGDLWKNEEYRLAEDGTCLNINNDSPPDTLPLIADIRDAMDKERP